MTFEPNFQYMVDAARNRKPARLPLYEHIISTETMAAALHTEMTMDNNSPASIRAFWKNYCRFWKEMTYDTVSFEAGICGLLPGSGAILGGRPGPIQTRADFERYPFDEYPERFWKYWTPHLDALGEALPDGMRALGGCGNGVFEISEDLVGYEYLCLLMFEDPDLFADLYARIGDLMAGLWDRMLTDYGDLFCICRMGDDLGYKTSTMISPEIIREFILPQYKRIVDRVHQAGKPFLLHSCGCIFSVMDDLIGGVGIDAKHSNEDQIAPFSNWIERYSDRIGLFGGIDLDLLCRSDPKTARATISRLGKRFRDTARGYAIGSGNSIPNYVPVEAYLAMVEAAKDIRKMEKA